MKKGYFAKKPNFHFPPLLMKLKRGGPAITQPKDAGLIIGYTGLGKNSKVLELGSGTGFMTVQLANIAKEVVSYDIMVNPAEKGRLTVEQPFLAFSDYTTSSQRVTLTANEQVSFFVEVIDTEYVFSHFEINGEKWINNPINIGTVTQNGYCQAVFTKIGTGPVSSNIGIFAFFIVLALLFGFIALRGVR